MRRPRGRDEYPLSRVHFLGTGFKFFGDRVFIFWGQGFSSGDRDFQGIWGVREQGI